MRRFYVRKFLNRPRYQSIGMILADASMTESVSRKGEYDFEAHFKIGDCSRTIDLDFNIWTDSKEGDIANIEYKSEVLRTVVNDFLDRVDEAAEFMREQLENRDD